jgi:hypothetical protein
MPGLANITFRSQQPLQPHPTVRLLLSVLSPLYLPAPLSLSPVFSSNNNNYYDYLSSDFPRLLSPCLPLRRAPQPTALRSTHCQIGDSQWRSNPLMDKMAVRALLGHRALVRFSVLSLDILLSNLTS